MKKFFKNIIEAIISPFVAIAVLIDESKRIDEDGSWERHWEKVEAKRLKKEARKQSRG